MIPNSHHPLHVVVDVVIFNIIDQQLHILLVQRATAPYRDSRCLPWWFVERDESVEQTVNKVLYRETGIICDHIQQFAVFSEIQRDPRGRTISLGYYAILSDDVLIPRWGKQQITAKFIPWKQLPPLGFDHDEIVRAAYARLQQDVQWSDIIRHFLPRYFTMLQLQSYCEIIYNRSFEKRNFSKYVQTHFSIQQTKQKELYVAHRPASLYKFL